MPSLTLNLHCFRKFILSTKFYDICLALKLGQCWTACVSCAKDTWHVGFCLYSDGAISACVCGVVDCKCARFKALNLFGMLRMCREL